MSIIHDITQVYNYESCRNTWCNTKLLALFMHTVEDSHIDNYRITEEKLISLKGDHVDHPLFGKTKRYGWTSMGNLMNILLLYVIIPKLCVEIYFNSRLKC